MLHQQFLNLVSQFAFLQREMSSLKTYFLQLQQNHIPSFERPRLEFEALYAEITTP